MLSAIDVISSIGAVMMIVRVATRGEFCIVSATGEIVQLWL